MTQIQASALVRQYRTKDTEVEAVLLTASNVRQVASWIALNGGSVAGMSYRDSGEIAQRGIRIGTLDGEEIIFQVGSYVVRDHHGGFFAADADGVFHRVFDLVLRPEDVESSLKQRLG